MRFMKDGSRFSSLEARLLFFGSGEKLPDYSREYELVHSAAKELPSVQKFLAIKATLDDEIQRLREIESRIEALEASNISAEREVDRVWQLNFDHAEADNCRKTIAGLTERAVRAWKAARQDVIAFERQESAKLVASAGQRKEELLARLIPRLEEIVSELCRENSGLTNLMTAFQPESVQAVLGDEPVLSAENWKAERVNS